MERLIELSRDEDLAASTRRGGVAACPLVPWALVLLVTGAIVAVASGPVPEEDRDPWAAHLRKTDEALSQRDHGAAIRHWNLAYRAAARTEGWEGIATVGQAYFRLMPQLGDDRQSAMLAPGPIVLRGVFHTVLARALRQGSAEGVLRAAEGFAALGDTDMAERCRQAAANQKAKGERLKARDSSS